MGSPIRQVGALGTVSEQATAPPEPIADSPSPARVGPDSPEGPPVPREPDLQLDELPPHGHRQRAETADEGHCLAVHHAARVSADGRVSGDQQRYLALRRQGRSGALIDDAQDRGRGRPRQILEASVLIGPKKREGPLG